jgi:hypothetical protein
MAGCACGSRCGIIFGWVVVVACAVLTPGDATAAPEVETRDFSVFVDGKPSGDVHMTINKQDDGSVIVNCDTDIKVVVLIKQYIYSYRGREVWKDGRIFRFDSNCTDDGKRFAVAGVADGDKLRVRVNGEEKITRGDVWLSSYWAMPENSRINQAVPIIDADTGVEFSAKIEFLGVESRKVAGQQQKVNHFRLSGGLQRELWFDVTGRLVAEEWLEEGKYRTQVELNRLRR